MDYSQTYFPGAPPYQFLGGAQVSPLTPAHSNSVVSEDFSNTSPPEIYDQFPGGISHDQYQNFDNANGYLQFNPAQAFPNPPTPPVSHPVQGSVPPVNGFVQQSGPTPDVLAVSKVEAEEQSRRQGSNSEEDDLTPAQSKRKAQNRAAQRAFRERKERHVKDLENRLQDLEQAQQQTVSENERLKRDLQKISTENEILRATSSMVAAGSPSAHAMPITTGPMTYNPTDFYSDVLQGHTNKAPSHRGGERLLAAGATWDLIINHELFKRGLVDVSKVSERLRPQAKCDGQGPVFEERAIIEAIEESAAEGSDELI
ncbi:AP-1-like transcription factor [Collariella sp. IMI 366227]|nr:AP-1-like transcription factor [Collariella sp. IMI 366227]